MTRHPLTGKQRAFFERQKLAIVRIDAAMQGALQMIVEELELKGRVKLADDCSEMLVEEDEPASPQ